VFRANTLNFQPLSAIAGAQPGFSARSAARRNPRDLHRPHDADGAEMFLMASLMFLMEAAAFLMARLMFLMAKLGDLDGLDGASDQNRERQRRGSSNDHRPSRERVRSLPLLT